MADIKYKRPQIEVEYDGVAMVDGLPAHDRANWRVSEELDRILHAASIKSITARCGNRLGALAAFKEIRTRAEAGEQYCIHVIAHGNTRGLVIGPTDFVSWRDFGTALVPINRALNGQLIVNMTSCKGIHGIKGGDLATDRDPFFGILGVNHDLEFTEALTLNERVYRLWFGGMAINEIVHEINNTAGREIMFCASAEGFRQLSKPWGGIRGDTVLNSRVCPARICRLK